MADDKTNLKMMELREMMKAADNEDILSDQQQGLPQPPMGKSYGGAKIISLTKNFEGVVKNNDFLKVLLNRTSKRRYSDGSLTIDELAFLLWSTQGVRDIVGKERKATLRMVPSAGARHPFETYLFINRVEGLEQGLYHYLALEHKLEFIKSIESQPDRVTEAYCEQTFFGNAAISFVWTVIPYRSEWRYTTDAHKYSLVDVGHVCQNLYLASEAIGCGTCAIGAYDQTLADELLGLNSKPSYEKENEFVVYAASVGKMEEAKVE